MDFSEILKNAGALEQLASQFGLDNTQVESIINSAVPEISNGINKNTSSEEGLKSFWDALNDHKDAPVEDMLQDVEKVDTEDGGKILGHILGERTTEVEQNLSQAQGISAGAVGGILKFLAPLIMGMIGRQAVSKKPAVNPEVGGGIIDSILGGDSPVSKMTKNMLDQNNDGSILDDLLGKLFGRKEYKLNK